MNRIPKDVLCNHLAPFLDLYEVCMMNNVLRKVEDMYKFVKHTNIMQFTDIKTLVAKCPNINSIVIAHNFHTKYNDISEEDKRIHFIEDEHDVYDILAKLPIERIVFARRIRLLYLNVFNKLKYVEGDDLNMDHIPPKLIEVNCRDDMSCTPNRAEQLKTVRYEYHDFIDKSFRESCVGISYNIRTSNQRTVSHVIKEISRYKNLTELSILASPNFTVLPDINELSHFKLQKLCIGGGTVPESFYHMPLTSLDLEDANVTNLPFNNLQCFSMIDGTLDCRLLIGKPIHTLMFRGTNLTNLDVIFTLPLRKLILRNIDITCLIDKFRHTKIEELSFTNIKIDTLPVFPTTLRKLCLGHTPLPQYILPQNISDLSIFGSSIDRHDMENITRLPWLSSLMLSGCGLTDELMTYLRGCQLQKLNITNNSITTAGIMNLRGMQLRSLTCDELSIIKLIN